MEGEGCGQTMLDAFCLIDPLPLASSDIDKIHTGIGDKVALFIQWIAVFVGGFAVGFVRDWRLTLLLLGFTPFLAISGAIMVTVCVCVCAHILYAFFVVSCFLPV